MEVVHARCAGLDISKKDAKVCVRIAGAGRRRTLETVTTWSAMTNQVLALREHLISEQVTCVVMEATGDYWKPFYYLLEDLEGVRGDVGQRPAREEPSGTARPTSRMRPGWPSSAPTAWSAVRSCRPPRSVSSAT